MINKPNFKNKTIWTGDNLDIMRGMNSECVDLIYLDPPFNSNANYAAPIGSKAAGAAFKDTWTLTEIDVEWIDLIQQRHPALHRILLAAMTDSDKAYLVYMAVRLLEMHRILKPDGGGHFPALRQTYEPFPENGPRCNLWKEEFQERNYLALSNLHWKCEKILAS